MFARLDNAGHAVEGPSYSVSDQPGWHRVNSYKKEG